MNFKFEIHGRSDSDYDVTNTDDRRSISGGSRGFLKGASVVFQRVSQKPVMLLTTEAKLSAGVMNAQIMVYMCIM